MTAVPIAGWLTGVVIATYPCCLLLMKLMLEGRTPDQTDWVFGGVIGFCVALLWPVVVFGTIAFWISRRIAEAVMGSDDKEGVDR